MVFFGSSTNRSTIATTQASVSSTVIGASARLFGAALSQESRFMSDVPTRLKQCRGFRDGRARRSRGRLPDAFHLDDERRTAVGVCPSDLTSKVERRKAVGGWPARFTWSVERRKAVGGWLAALHCGGRRCASTALRCSPRGRGAELASLTAFAALKQPRRVRSRSAHCVRADRTAALLGAAEARRQ